MTQQRVHCHSPPPKLQRKLRDHWQWLVSGGADGVRLGSDGKNLNLAGLDLNDADLSLGLLSGVPFKASTLRNAWLMYAQLDGAGFVGCDLTAARCDDAIMTHAVLIEAKYPNAVFKDVDVESVVWTKADMEHMLHRHDIASTAFDQERKLWSPHQHATYKQRIEDAARAAEQQQVDHLPEQLAAWRIARFQALP